MFVELTSKNVAMTLLLLFAGAATAVTVVSRDERGARPTTDGGSTGTGTVVGGNDPEDGAGDPAAPSGVFHIAGRVTGLRPGAAATLPITVANPNPYPIEVLTLDTGVVTPADAACPAGSLRIGRYVAGEGPAVTAPARGTVRVEVPVELTDSATQDQSGCAGATFPLTFTGTARTTR